MQATHNAMQTISDLSIRKRVALWRLNIIRQSVVNRQWLPEAVRLYWRNLAKHADLCTLIEHGNATQVRHSSGADGLRGRPRRESRPRCRPRQGGGRAGRAPRLSARALPLALLLPARGPR